SVERRQGAFDRELRRRAHVLTLGADHAEPGDGKTHRRDEQKAARVVAARGGVDFVGHSLLLSSKLTPSRFRFTGRAFPALTHTSNASTNLSCESGGVVRPVPGDQAHSTSGSVFMCSMICSAVWRPPFRAGSFICSQICCALRPSQSIDKGAKGQSATPGTKPSAVFIV